MTILTESTPSRSGQRGFLTQEAQGRLPGNQDRDSPQINANPIPSAQFNFRIRHASTENGHVKAKDNQLEPAKLHLNLRLRFNTARCTSEVAVSKSFDLVCRDCPYSSKFHFERCLQFLDLRGVQRPDQRIAERQKQSGGSPSSSSMAETAAPTPATISSILATCTRDANVQSRSTANCRFTRSS